MRPVVIAIDLPLAQLLVEEVDVVGNVVSVQQLVELLVVHAMGSFHLAVQVRRPGPDVDVADVQPLEVRLKLRAFIGLDDVDAEG